MIGRLRIHVGNRGSCLLAFSLVDVLWAIYLLTGPSGTTQRWFDAVIPIAYWAVAWILAGLACFVYAFRDDDRAGFIVAIGIKVVWAGGCLIGWAMSDVTLGAVGIWIGFAWLVWRISGWAEPVMISEDRERDD